MAELILIRGLPGSGKSTLAKSLCSVVSTWRHVEADQYFTDPNDGTYTFIPQWISNAHKWCQYHTSYLLSEGYNVVVSNTFTQLWEMEPYFKMGADKVTIITCEGSYATCTGCRLIRWRRCARGGSRSLKCGLKTYFVSNKQ